MYCRAMDTAAAYGYIDVVQFLHENRNEGCTIDAIDNAAKNGHLEVVQYLYKNRKEGCTTYAIDMAAKYGYFDVVQFLLDKQRFSSSAILLAEENGHSEVVQLLKLHQTRNP
jgi:ankyrin repeat protein